MKFSHGLIFITLLTLSLFIGVKDLYTNSGTPPAARVGAPPNGLTCNSAGCHDGNTVDPSNSIVQVKYGISVPTMDIANFAYVPGQQYTISVTYTGAIGSVYGFQMAIFDSSDNSTGVYEIAGANNDKTQVISDGSGREYITHKDANTTSAWTFKWTAPAAGSGDLVLYASMNGADGNGQANGDKIYTRELTFSEDMGSSIPLIAEEAVEVYPNPVKNGASIKFPEEFDFEQLKVYNLSGELMMIQNINSSEFNQDFNTLNAGIYLLSLEGVYSRTSIKMVKE